MYKVLEYFSQGNMPITEVYPLNGNKRLYLKYVEVLNKGEVSTEADNICISLLYAPREANLIKYKAVNNKSIIIVRFNVTPEGKIIYQTNLGKVNLRYAFFDFEEGFYKFIDTMPFMENFDNKNYIINLDGYGDLIVLYNKIVSFADINADADFMCINTYDIEPIMSESDTKITDYKGISQFNLKVNLNDGIGNNITVKSYHQDNKLKLKVKDSVNKVKVDLMKLRSTIDDINYMLDDNSRKNLGLMVNYDINTGSIYIQSNDTHIITFDTDDDFNSFIDGAKESFLRIIKMGICVITYQRKKYTCFKGVLNNGIIEYIAISGDVRIQTLSMKYDPIKLRN